MGPRAWHSRACPPASLRKVPLPASLPSRTLMDHPSFRALLTCHRFRTSSQLPPPSPHLQAAEVTALSSVLLKHRLASCLIPLRLFHPGWFLPSERSLSPSRPRGAGAVLDPFPLPQKSPEKGRAFERCSISACGIESYQSNTQAPLRNPRSKFSCIWTQEGSRQAPGRPTVAGRLKPFVPLLVTLPLSLLSSIHPSPGLSVCSGSGPGWVLGRRGEEG